MDPFKQRIQVLKVVYLIIIVTIICRLYYWQVLRFDDLSAKADAQHTVSYDLAAPRGQIFASDGSILATDKPVFLLYGQPKVIADKSGTAAQIAQILTQSKFAAQPQASIQDEKNYYDSLKQSLLDSLSQDLYWVTLEKDLDINVKNEIDKLNITGIGFENEVERFYPEASSAAHILGFVADNSVGDPTGYFGVEGFYNDELQGVSGSLTEEKDAQGVPILTGKFTEVDPQSGHDLNLNIDPAVQYTVEQNLKIGMEKYGAKSGSVVVMNPKTGAIVAMAAYPNYDANDFTQFPKANFKNPVVADSYEPGSTFKVLVMAAAINENLITPDTKCDICAGPVDISGYQIRTWDNKYFPNTTMRDVLIHSDNTGMTFVSRKLGLDKMYQYITDFGFGAPTGVDLQDEMSPDLRPKGQWGEIDLATSSFGQGIAVTPLQMVRAVSAIANGGYLMEPHVVKSINANGKLEVIQPKVVGHPISQQTALTVTQMMVDAVNQGEAKFFALKGYNIAGKTGTAQIPVAGHYDPTKTIASFVGFAPAENPKFVMLVRYDEPSSSIYGAETAAPTFFTIAKELLAYYDVVPQ